MKLARVLLTSLFVMLLVSHSISARLLPTNQGSSTEAKIAHAGASSEAHEEDDIFNLMGWEECNKADEECLKRRMVAEAHLDYIYTQRHKPKP